MSKNTKKLNTVSECLSMAKALRGDGLIWEKIAAVLNTNGGKTASGTPWTGAAICSAACAKYPKLRTRTRRWQRKPSTGGPAKQAAEPRTKASGVRLIIKAITNSNLSDADKLTVIELINDL